jgi:hypothetical protein
MFSGKNEESIKKAIEFFQEACSMGDVDACNFVQKPDEQ